MPNKVDADPAQSNRVVLLPDAGPLITLAHADSLDLLFAFGWSVQLVDMVWHEVTRHATPTRQKLIDWENRHTLPVLQTRTFERHNSGVDTVPTKKTTADLGEWAIQEVMTDFASAPEPTIGVFLFEDHKVARATFLLPPTCQKVTTRAYLIFLEEQGLIASAAGVARAALQAGRAFSQLRFPPG